MTLPFWFGPLFVLILGLAIFGFALVADQVMKRL